MIGKRSRVYAPNLYTRIENKSELFTLKTKKGEMLTSYYQKELFNLNVSKEYTKTDTNEEGCFLFPYLFSFLWIKTCFCCFHILIYSQFVCYKHGTKGIQVFIKYLQLLFYRVYLCFILNEGRTKNKHNCAYFQIITAVFYQIQTVSVLLFVKAISYQFQAKYCTFSNGFATWFPIELIVEFSVSPGPQLCFTFQVIQKAEQHKKCTN